MRLLYLNIFFLSTLLFQGCCHLPLVDCFRYPKYFTPELKEKAVLYQTDSIAINIVPVIEKKIKSDSTGVINFLFILLEIHNDSKDSINISFQNIDIQLENKSRKKSFSGNVGKNDYTKIVKSNEEDTLKVQVLIDIINSSSFNFEKYDVRITIPEIFINEKEIKDKSAFFICRTH